MTISLADLKTYLFELPYAQLRRAYFAL